MRYLQQSLPKYTVLDRSDCPYSDRKIAALKLGYLHVGTRVFREVKNERTRALKIAYLARMDLFHEELEGFFNDTQIINIVSWLVDEGIVEIKDLGKKKGLRMCLTRQGKLILADVPNRKL